MSEIKTNACDTLAFLVVECGLSIQEAGDLSLDDPLFIALSKAYESKTTRQDNWVAKQCYYSMAAMNGSKGLDIERFKSFHFDKRSIQKTPEQEYAEWINFANKHNAAVSKAK